MTCPSVIGSDLRRRGKHVNDILHVPLGMEKWELPIEDGNVLDIVGRRIDGVDNDSGNRLRWAQLQLFKCLDRNPSHDSTLPEKDANRGMYGREIYLLYTTGHSVVVHDSKGKCRTGTRLPASRFPKENEDFRDLEPCPECNPDLSGLPLDGEEVDWEGGSLVFNLEVTWYSHTLCQDAGLVIDALRKCRHCSHRSHRAWTCACGCDEYMEGPLTSPGRKLVEQCVTLDPGIAAAYRGRKKI
jgi:hypothetical protein